MIVSHQHRFIFFKPNKVGGTSVHVSLAARCAPGDRVSRISRHSRRRDDDLYCVEGHNAEGLRAHAEPRAIRELIGPDQWRDYTKITVVRNPWDLVVSSYYWEEWVRFHERSRTRTVRQRLRQWLRLRNPLGRSVRQDRTAFMNYLRALPERYLNRPYYFDASGQPLADVYLRFEHLQGDYDRLCLRLGLPCTRLPRLKTRCRPRNAAYAGYYNEQARALVAGLYQDQIDHFGYVFGENR